MIAVRIPRAVKIIAIVVLAYLALMTLVALPAINMLAPRIYREQTGRKLHLDKIILLNPFTLALSVRNASSANADGSRFWSFDLLRANVSLASVWRRHLVLDELQLSGLDLQIVQKDAARYNFSEILDYRQQHFPSAPATKKPAETPSAFPLSIHRLLFSAKHVGVRTPYGSEPLVLDLNDVSLGLIDLTTAEKATPLRTGGIDIALKTIALKFLREQEPFATQLQDLHVTVTELASNATDEQPFSFSVSDSGGGQLAVKAAFALGAQHSDGTVTLRNLNLVPAWHFLSPKLAFTTERAALDGELHFTLDWTKPLRYTLANSRINLHDVQLQSKADNNTRVALGALQVDGIAVDSTTPRAQIAKVALREPVINGWNRDTQVSLLDMFHSDSAAPEDTSPPWQIQIDAIDAQGGSIHWQASQLPDIALVVAPLSAHVSHVHWPEAKPLQLQFNTTINDSTKLGVQGELTPNDLTGKFSGEIAGLPVAWANSLLGQHMRATLSSGLLSANAQLAVEKGALTDVRSDGSIDQLELQQLPDNRKLVAWKQLQWKQLALDLRKNQLQLQRVAIEQPWTQLRINQDGTNNFQQLMVAQKASAPVQPQPSNQPKTQPQSKSEKPWQLAVNTVHIEKALLDFRDNSLSRAFRATIADFTGDITGLSNRGKSSAKVAMKGTVDGYAPVALSGTVNPFATPPALNVALDITNLDLATFTPYSGTYAGYVIDSGRLSVQLNYTLEDKRIKGTNHVVVNQLQLGAQVTGPKVMDLPLRFAIYLLTDSNGVMDLGVDVAGSVDDPDFSVRSVIWKAFRNLIFKTVSSPFRALANLAGGAHQDDMDRIEFTPGSDQVNPENTDKLRTLVKALQQKAALKLAVVGHVSPSHDIEALRDNDLSQQLIAEGGITPADIQQQSKNWQREVGKLFSKRFPARKSETLASMQMNDAMRDNIELPSSALSELANRRALAVKQLLVTTLALPVERVSVNPVDLGADKNPGPQATLEVN
jgi:hypothetical protein